ncbi:MAG TPA: ABC transporter ATP-binding protein [Clostridia bacterium]|nr:ABC transporter ATP-binding protein [Clostridia bacterium]HRX41755.1 ABC transporter ATP-binding protein [Clostridia bacterium]
MSGMGRGYGRRSLDQVSSDEKKKLDKNALKKLLRHAVPFWKHFLLALILVLALTGAEIIRPYIMGTVIDNIKLATDDPAGLLGYRKEIWLLGGAFMGLAILQLVLSYFSTYILQATSAKVVMRLRNKLFKHVQDLPFTFFDKTAVGSIVTRICNDTNTISEMYTGVLVNFFRDMFEMTGVIIVMFLLNVKLALTVMAVLPLMAFAAIMFRTKARKTFTRIRARLSAINIFLSEHIAGMKIIQAFNMQNAKKGEFENVNREYLDENNKMIVIFGIFRPFMEVVSAIATALILWVGGNNIIEGAISFGTVYMFINYAGKFFHPIMNLTEMYNTVQSSLVSSDRIETLLKRQPEEVPEDAVELGDIKGEIEFRNVWFAYVGENWVLKDVSFKVKPGEKVAIVGTTGAGKTTIISLILGFYKHQKGEILIDGVPLSKINMKELRKAVGTVRQDVFLFQGDIETNIRLYNDISREKVIEAAQTVNASKFIDLLPDKYEEPVNQRGTTLSEGQRQLLSFARALVMDPKILVLDEATSSVDANTEALIQDGMEKLMEGRTSITIAHRLSTIKNSDRIMFLHHGRVAESGSHAELMEHGKLYYELYSIQYS